MDKSVIEIMTVVSGIIFLLDMYASSVIMSYRQGISGGLLFALQLMQVVAILPLALFLFGLYTRFEKPKEEIKK
jgi:hypothetical protein